jgi:putative restriction endonuclease
MKNGKIFGEIPGFPVGSTFVNRVVASEDGVHTPQMQGISGDRRDGANSRS